MAAAEQSGTGPGTSEPTPRRRDWALRLSRDAPNAAVLIEAPLYLCGAALTATALMDPHVSSPTGVLAIAAVACVTAAALLLAYRRRRIGLTRAVWRGPSCPVSLLESRRSRTERELSIQAPSCSFPFAPIALPYDPAVAYDLPLLPVSPRANQAQPAASPNRRNCED
jgi:hypothetical protein